MSEDRFDPATYIHDVFMELRELHSHGHAKLIEDEVLFMLRGHVLHADDGSDCLGVAKAVADAIVFDPEADVISEHLTTTGELTDLAAEAIVRRLTRANDLLERARFDSWLDVYGYESLKERKN